jgi:hypothetical protein
MSLPKLQAPIFELKLPSTGEIVKHTLFTLKEEKILLLAQESKDVGQSILAMKQVVNNCIIDKNIDEFSLFDLEYILLQLRAKSIDNNVKFTITDPETNEKVDLELDLNHVQLITPENHKNVIKINEDFFLYMRYPTIVEFQDLLKEGINNPQSNFNTLIRCMDKLVSKTEVYNFKDFSIEEITAFAEDLNSTNIQEMKQFFETMPSLRHEIKYTNKNGTEKTFVIQGMQTFFI